MKIMNFRYTSLKTSVDGLQATEVPLVSLQNQSYSPSGYADDMGIYYFIPWMVKNWGISLDSAIYFFFSSLILTGLIIGGFCFFAAFKYSLARCISTIGHTLLAIVSFFTRDVYVTSFFAVACTLPVFILWDRKKFPVNKNLFALIFCCGILISYSNIIRIHAGTGALLFFIAWIFLKQQFSKTNKCFCILILFLSLLLPQLHFYILKTNRDHFLKKTVFDYQPISVTHPTWHSTYIGFGYLANPYGIKYNDIIAFNKAVSVDPDVVFYSKKYQKILKNACIEMVKKDPLFVLKTVLVKLLNLFRKILLYANVGLLLTFYVKPPFRLIFPFLIATVFYSLAGVLTIPTRAYVLGMITCSTFFGIYMICLSIEKYYHHPKRLLNRLEG